MVLTQRRWRVSAFITALLVYGLYYLSNANSMIIVLDRSSPIRPHKLFEFPKDNKVHFSKLPEKYPVSSYIPMPTGKPLDIPRIQAPRPKEDATTKQERLQRQAAVKDAFEHSWAGYKKHAWLKDEVIPVKGGYRDPFGGWAATLVDSLDTLWVMGMKDEFDVAVSAIKGIDFTTTDAKDINVFETTIRYLGGFLAAYDISGAKYPILVDKAQEVGDLLMACFDTPNRLPITRWDWKRYMKGEPQQAAMSMIVSELGSLTLEFTRLAQLTDDPRYYDAIQRCSDLFEEHQNQTKLPGMWPVFVDAATPRMNQDSNFHLGGMSDSLYEYLPKQYMMLGGLLEQPRTMYENFMTVARKSLFFKPLNPANADILVAGHLKVTASGVSLSAQGEHLTCFAGGMIALASRIFDIPSDLKIGAALTEGCIWSYDSQVTGIGPEIFMPIMCDEKDDDCIWSDERWHSQITTPPPPTAEPDALAAYSQSVITTIRDRRLAPGFTGYLDTKYILRPEAIESVFMMYRITGEQKWADSAWRMFNAIVKQTKTSIAFSAISDVTSHKPQKTDSMESFWLAETLKYFYLIFSDWDVMDLDVYVLNTEAHPLKRPGR